LPFAERPAVILLVDDTSEVRGLMVRLLTRAGFTVLEAASGHEALEILSGHQDPLDLLITDVSLPDINGVDLAARVQGLNPGIQTLFVSGRGRLDLRNVRGRFLAKPFSMDELLGAVKQMLEQAG
jgi:two-component system cell cycle sensor histidine kinase/response regulator CckA